MSVASSLAGSNVSVAGTQAQRQCVPRSQTSTARVSRPAVLAPQRPASFQRAQAMSQQAVTASAAPAEASFLSQADIHQFHQDGMEEGLVMLCQEAARPALTTCMCRICGPGEFRFPRGMRCSD